jgi:uncharacterized coiled-coil protein SlyX
MPEAINTPFVSLMSDQDRHRLKELSVTLKQKEQNLALYKDTLANLIRRLHDMTAVVSKLHRRTEQEIKEVDVIITDIKAVLGETPNKLF